MTASVKNRIRVLHFVSGGFSGGATQVAIQLTEAALAESTIEPLLVLRRKRHTAKNRVRELERRGLPVATVPGWSHLATVLALVKLCRRFRPHVLVAHGFSEHLWGRYAGLIAAVPALVQVEHNTRERYTRWRLAQAHWLARRTARIIACGPGVLERLRELGFSTEQTQVIANGIDLAPFANADAKTFAEREPAAMMVARFGAQKDHPTLIRAIAELRDRGCRVPLYLAGGGKERHRQRAMRLAHELGVQDQVVFCGLLRDVPQRLQQLQIAVLSTHHEGMPLALVEAMAAGCAVVGSRVPGVKEIIRDGENGLLCEHQDPRSLADALQRLLGDAQLAQRLGSAARREALGNYGRERMNRDYENLFVELVTHRGEPAR